MSRRMADQDIWYMYVLECQNGNLDTGITNNVQRRILEHKFGKGGKFTKDLGVKQMLYKERGKSKLKDGRTERN
jgi:putative endonuclease